MVVTNLTQPGPAYSLVDFNNTNNGSVADTGAAMEEEMYEINDRLIGKSPAFCFDEYLLFVGLLFTQLTTRIRRVRRLSS